MFQNLRKSKRAVSTVIATVIIIALVVAASAIVGLVILNIDVVDLPWGNEEIITKDVSLSITLISYNDTDIDSFYDTIVFYVSSDIDSPSIYVNDIDIILPTGITLDTVNPWVIATTPLSWNIEFQGFSLPYGTINATFEIQASNLDINDGELANDESFYIIINYTYISELGPRVEVLTSFYQSEMLMII